MEQPLIRIEYSLQDIDKAVAQFWAAAQAYRVFAFSGELGAGKTTFIHKLCDQLGVTDAVSSPTFALINEYHFRDAGGKDKTIYHLDWYRLKDSREAFNAGMEDCLDEAKAGKALCFIEWPEKARELLPAPYLWISIETTDLDKREMTVRVVN